MVTMNRKVDEARSVVAHPWALLVYTLPREPSGPRVAAWRKLKKLGALLLHDGVWVVPDRPALIEHFRWLASDIREAGGDALVWVAELTLPGQDDELTRLFIAQAEVEYQALLAALDTPGAERRTLARRYRQVLMTDHFHAPSSDLVRSRLEGGTA